MALHLRKDPITGHLLKHPENGHLIKDCAAALAYMQAKSCDGDSDVNMWIALPHALPYYLHLDGFNSMGLDPGCYYFKTGNNTSDTPGTILHGTTFPAASCLCTCIEALTCLGDSPSGFHFPLFDSTHVMLGDGSIVSLPFYFSLSDDPCAVCYFIDTGNPTTSDACTGFRRDQITVRSECCFNNIWVGVRTCCGDKLLGYVPLYGNNSLTSFLTLHDHAVGFKIDDGEGTKVCVYFDFVTEVCDADIVDKRTFPLTEDTEELGGCGDADCICCDPPEVPLTCPAEMGLPDVVTVSVTGCNPATSPCVDVPIRVANYAGTSIPPGGVEWDGRCYKQGDPDCVWNAAPEALDDNHYINCGGQFWRFAGCSVARTGTIEGVCSWNANVSTGSTGSGVITGIASGTKASGASPSGTYTTGGECATGMTVG